MRIPATLVFVALTLPNAFADDCDFIRQAITQLSPKGGTITIPAGTYDCTSMIQIKRDGVKLQGAGREKTILRLADQHHAPLLVIGDDKVVQNASGDWVTATRVSDIDISDLTVDGNVVNHDPTKECGEGSCDGDISAIRNNAITIRGASRVNMARVTARSAISGGLVTEKYCDELHVSDFTSYGNYFDGFAGYQTEHSTFERINLSHNRGAGISIDIEFNRNRFSGGRLAYNGDVGIFARDTNEVVFENLDILASGNHGVFLADADQPKTCANDNEFRSVTIEGSKGFGFHLSSPCTGNRITGTSVLKENRKGCYYVNAATKLEVASTVSCVEGLTAP